jgi:hypothetical protein
MELSSRFLEFVRLSDAGVSSDKLRQCARCTACGHKGATIQHPGWGGEHLGFMPFPGKL